METDETAAAAAGHEQAIKPSMFKTLIGKNHPEFSTKRQQDAVEFLLHFINVTEVINKRDNNVILVQLFNTRVDVILKFD